MFFAQFAYFKVLTVSSNWDSPGDAVAIITVLQFPPSESFNILVNFESQYGTCVDTPSVRCFITIPREVRDLLILFASFKVIPVAPVFVIFSDPARSTRNNFPVFTLRSNDEF